MHLIGWLTVGIAMSGGTAARAADLRIPTAVVQIGTSAGLSVVYRSNGEGVAALQCDLEYDQQDILITAVTAGSAAVLAGKTVQTAVLPNGNTRILLVGFNQTVLADGDVIDLNVRVNPSAAVGNHSLRCNDVQTVGPNGDVIDSKVQEGRIVATPNKD